jgi:hypothetical protein
MAELKFGEEIDLDKGVRFHEHFLLFRSVVLFCTKYKYCVVIKIYTKEYLLHIFNVFISDICNCHNVYKCWKYTQHSLVTIIP